MRVLELYVALGNQLICVQCVHWEHLKRKKLQLLAEDTLLSNYEFLWNCKTLLTWKLIYLLTLYPIHSLITHRPKRACGTPCRRLAGGGLRWYTMRAYWMMNDDSGWIHTNENIFTEWDSFASNYHRDSMAMCRNLSQKNSSILIEWSVCTRFFAINVRMCDMRGTQVLPRKHLGEEKWSPTWVVVPNSAGYY